VSVLGDIARVAPEELEQLRQDSVGAYRHLSRAPRIPLLDVDRYWDILRLLLTHAGVPVNPIDGGELYPDAESARG
jgi:hypothetical protein